MQAAVLALVVALAMPAGRQTSAPLNKGRAYLSRKLPNAWRFSGVVPARVTVDPEGK